MKNYQKRLIFLTAFIGSIIVWGAVWFYCNDMLENKLERWKLRVLIDGGRHYKNEFLATYLEITREFSVMAIAFSALAVLYLAFSNLPKIVLITSKVVSVAFCFFANIWAIYSSFHFLTYLIAPHMQNRPPVFVALSFFVLSVGVFVGALLWAIKIFVGRRRRKQNS